MQLVETSNQHYKVLITPDQSVTTVLSTSAGFYNSLLSHKKGWNFSYLKLLSPIDLRSSYLFVEWLFGSNVSNERKMLFGSSVSNKRYVGCCLDLVSQTNYPCTYTNILNEIKMIVERDVKRFDSFCFERDNCFVFQTLALLLQWPLLFIELKSLGEQAKTELLCFLLNFEIWLQRNLGSKHVENVSSLLPRTFSRSQPILHENCRARAC